MYEKNTIIKSFIKKSNNSVLSMTFIKYKVVADDSWLITNYYHVLREENGHNKIKTVLKKGNNYFWFGLF